MNLLEVKNICKIYGSGETAVKALKNINFSAQKVSMQRLSGKAVREKVHC